MTPDAPGAPWLEVRGVSKRYGGVTALNAVDMTLRTGEIRGLIGVNGAGKSTLVRVLTGEVVPDDGELLIDGRPVSFRRPADARAAGISVMPQELTLAPHLTVADNIALGQEPSRFGLVDRSAVRAAAVTAIEKLGTSICPDARVETLSLVDQRLVMAARALVSNARLIVLDEPTAAMAPAEVHLVLEVVERLADQGVACLYVSHRLDEVIELAHHVTAMRDGHVVEEVEHADMNSATLMKLICPGEGTSVARTRGLVSGDVAMSCVGLEGDQLRGLDVTVRAGEIVGLAGLVGSGAEETMAILAGIKPATSGTVTVGTETLALGNRLAAVRAGIGYLPGDRSLAVIPNHKVRENVTISSLAHHARLGVLSIRSEVTAIGPLLQRVRFSRSHDTVISKLSGGNQQKALFARWLAKELKVLLLDDPTAGVDVGARGEIHDQIRQLADDGAAVMIVSTDLDELVALADRVVVLNRGVAVGELTTPITENDVLRALISAGDRAGV
jgi:ribose transport system ATP-binding protein